MYERQMERGEGGERDREKKRRGALGAELYVAAGVDAAEVMMQQHAVVHSTAIHHTSLHNRLQLDIFLTVNKNLK